MSDHYELLIIITSTVDESQQEALVKKVEQLVQDAGGEITRVDPWGKQQLAYEINHEQYGTYVLMEFDAPSEVPPTLTKSLKLIPEIMRSMIVTRRVRSAQEVNAQKRLQEKIHAERAAHEQREEEAAQKEAEQSEQTTALESDTTKEEAQAKPDPKESSKISLEDLDKKLDDILKEDI